jgi:hypothetical protein
VQFLISSTLPKVHKAPELNQVVSKHGHGIQSVPQIELPFFQTSRLLARREKLFFVLESFQNIVNSSAASNKKKH